MQTVYVLGAGSSVVDNAPAMAEFRKAAIRVQNSLQGQPGEEMFRTALDYWNQTIPTANIEEYYVLLDLLEKIGAKDPGPNAASQVANVKYLIAKTLQLSMGSRLSSTHVDFVRRVWDICEDRHPFAISMNWDIALDRAANYGHTQFSLDYGISAAKPIPISAVERKEGKFTVLKLHGSTNWWFCDKCMCLWYSLDVKNAPMFWEHLDPPKCQDENPPNPMVPLFVPPASQKFESSRFTPILSEIWNKAREILSTADEIVFVGYSFPPTDMQFRMLLIEALARNRALKTIAVVTSPKFGTRRVDFENRYSSLFEGTPNLHKLRFRYSTFDQWVKREGCALYDAPRMAQ